MNAFTKLAVRLIGWTLGASIIIPGENWPKICKEMYEALPDPQAAKALKIVIKHTKDQ